MSELTWKKAIEKVFLEERRALHYTEVAEIIADRAYRTKMGRTPQDTVSAQMTTDINKNGDHSVFVKVSRGVYYLRALLNETEVKLDSEQKKAAKEINQKEDTGKIINSFGIYWDRDLVDWSTANPHLWAVQQRGADPINFKKQVGIYLLHDSRETIYVGQAIKQTLGKRLKDHTTDRLGSRWDRFSWFGFYQLDKQGDLMEKDLLGEISLTQLADILEATLIESIEPRQNRKQGNSFSGIEYLQKEDPEISNKKAKHIISELFTNKN